MCARPKWRRGGAAVAHLAGAACSGESRRTVPSWFASMASIRRVSSEGDDGGAATAPSHTTSVCGGPKGLRRRCGVSGLEKGSLLSIELEGNLQGEYTHASGCILPKDAGDTLESPLLGKWLILPDSPASSLDGLKITSPSSPTNPRRPESKATSMLSPASPLDTGCWSLGPGVKHTKKLKQSVLGEDEIALPAIVT